MKELIAACGLNCAECGAFIATQASDDEKLAAVAKEWVRQYGLEIDPSMCVCDGCKVGGRLSTAHAIKCQIRICVEKRGLPTCAHCENYMCKKLEEFVEYAPGLKTKLEAIRGTLGD